MMVILRPVFIELFGPLKAGTLLSYIATNPQPNGSAIKWLYNHQWAGVNALSLMAVWCSDPSTKLSTSTDAAIEPNIIIMMYIFFSLCISTSFGINAGIWAIFLQRFSVTKLYKQCIAINTNKTEKRRKTQILCHE